MKLQDNYDAAIARATAPITATYVKELEKLKADYTRAGDLKSALAADELIKEALAAVKESSGGGDGTGVPLAEMTERQFKRWLSKVVIAEVDSPSMNQYFFDGETLTTMRPGLAAPRTHQNANIQPGKVFVPFTNTNATITIDPSMTKAEVVYSTGGRHAATISPKPKE